MSEDTEDPVAFLHPVEIGDLFYTGPAIRAWIVGCEGDEARLQSVEVPVERCSVQARGKRAAHPGPRAQPRIGWRLR